MKNIYFDNNASTAVDHRVLEAILPYFLEQYGNPSSIHKKGVEAERAVKDSREKLAQFLQVKAEEVIFTSCGTEAVNLAIKGIARSLKKTGKHIIASKIEHESVLESLKELQAEGFDISWASPDAFGTITSESVCQHIQNQTILAVVMHANNELGTINPIQEIGAAIKRLNPKIKFFSDGIQAFGKLPIDLKNVDAYAISGHKIHAPKGIGALICKDNHSLQTQISGGGQEFNKRSGTENVPSIVGFTKAAEIIFQDFTFYQKHLEHLKLRFTEGLKNMDDVIINSPKHALNNTLHVSFLKIPSEPLIHALEDYGIFVSAGSACHSSKKQHSHVLTGIGLPIAHIESAIRISFSRFNSFDEIDVVINVLMKLTKELRSLVKKH